MAALRDIKRRIKSVKNTRQITKAMKMVSAAKLRRAQDEIHAARPYANKIKELVAALSTKVMPESHPLLSKASTGKAELILVTSDRGLCGGFNSQLIRTAERFMREHPELKVGLNIVGKRAIDFYKRRESGVFGARPVGAGRPGVGLARAIAQDVIDGYLKDRSDEVYLIYSEFKSALTQRPVVQKLLPVVPPDVAGGGEGYLFEPSLEEVLTELLPKYVEVQVLRALLESSASEHGARMTAMDSASKNASEMIGALTLQYNRARQASITKELMEIIGGAEALK